MGKGNQTRTEKDSLGSIKVPKNAYFGSFTERAKRNFQISGITAPEIFQKALGIVKLATAEANTELGLLNKKHFKAIEQACKEFIAGKFKNEFILDIFQSGAGTAYNMNANEIIANRANELLGEKKGEYTLIHPNNHVNLAQSTNDVIPTATRIAILLSLPSLLEEIEAIEKELGKKISEYKNITKVGRTHLQDAVPITFGQEFDSFKEAIKKSRIFIKERSEDLKTLGIGGTAVGTGINTDPQYKKLTTFNLSKILEIRLKSADNLTEMTNNMNTFVNFSAALRSLAIDMINFANNLKLMGMGPKAGISEIFLPKVQPGSSIMPGKINPSIPESMEMVCFQVLGNDKTIELAAQRGQFELNPMCPIIMYNIIQSIQILTNGIRTLRELCIKGLKINKEKVRKTFENSICTATILTPYIGYHPTAEIVKSALRRNSSIKKEVLRRKIFTEKEINEILSSSLTTQPAKLNTKLIKKVQY